MRMAIEGDARRRSALAGPEQGDDCVIPEDFMDRSLCVSADVRGGHQPYPMPQSSLWGSGRGCRACCSAPSMVAVIPPYVAVPGPFETAQSASVNASG